MSSWISSAGQLTFGAVMLLLVGAALLACCDPARRATKVDPMVAPWHDQPMRLYFLAIPALLLTSSLAARPALSRRVDARTLISAADPAASFTFDKAFHYAGGQHIDILGVAAAEQYFFIAAAADKSIRRFYWVQFEHYNANNTNTYDYSGIAQKPVELGRLAFMGDVRVRPHYFTMDDRPGSDSRAAEDFLRGKGYKLDGTFATLRLFHLPDSTKRRELMIIYGEVVPGGASDEAALSQISSRAQANVTVR